MPVPPPFPSSVPTTVYANNNLRNYQMASQNPSSVPTVLPNALPPVANAINNTTPQWLSHYATTGAGGVSQLTAGTGITLTPAGGTGVVSVAVSSPFFRGMIMPYVGTTAPSADWAICDGTTAGVPDLRGQFIIGTSVDYAFGTYGGASSVALTVNMLPDHIHGSAGLSSTSGNSGGGGFSFAQAGNTSGITSPGYTPGTPVPILPPYKSLNYIMKL